MQVPASVRVGDRPLRALRASRVFGMDEKRIHTENTVMHKGDKRLGLSLSKLKRRSSKYSPPVSDNNYSARFESQRMEKRAPGRAYTSVVPSAVVLKPPST